MKTLKLELIDGKYKLSKKTNNTWNFMMLSESELNQIVKLIEERGQALATSKRIFSTSKVFGRRH